MRLALVLSVLLLAACKTAGSASAVKDDDVAAASSLETAMFHFPGDLDVRVCQQLPPGDVKADILYLTGFADRCDNHGPLFSAWAAQGYRVVSYDYPSHGETTGPDLDTFAGATVFTGLASLTASVEEATRQDDERPLILAGWSTGGLLAVRMLEGVTLTHLARTPQSIILMAPGVAVRPLPGDDGTVTLATLTNNPNPPHNGPITPTSPLKFPLFAADLVANAALAWTETYTTIPTLVIVADNADAYVDTAKVMDWTSLERSVNGSHITGIQCTGAKHELDNEPDPTGASVRAAAVQFAVDGTAPPGGCGAF